MLAAPTGPDAHSVTHAIVPAAGLGTRLEPLSRLLPKEMLPLGRRPVLAWIFEELAAAGITHAVVVLSPQKWMVRDHFGAVYRAEHGDLALEYVAQAEPRGLGHAIRCAHPLVPAEPVAVAFGDCVIASRQAGGPMRALIAAHAPGSAATLLAERVPRALLGRYGILDAEADPAPGVAVRVRGLVEKPAPDDAPSDLAFSARLVMGPQVMEALAAAGPDETGEVGLTPLLGRLCRQGEVITAVLMGADERRYDIGAFDSYFAAFMAVAMDDPDAGMAARAAASAALAERASPTAAGG